MDKDRTLAEAGEDALVLGKRRFETTCHSIFVVLCLKLKQFHILELVLDSVFFEFGCLVVVRGHSTEDIFIIHRVHKFATLPILTLPSAISSTQLVVLDQV